MLVPDYLMLCIVKLMYDISMLSTSGHQRVKLALKSRLIGGQAPYLLIQLCICQMLRKTRSLTKAFNLLNKDGVNLL